MTKRAREAGPAARPHAAAPRASGALPAARGLFPGTAELLDPRGPYLIPLLLLLATRLAAWLAIGGAAEDAYITFRYAHHLAAGNGLVYNPGERVMGFSSPLWTVWNALGFVLTQQPLPWSRGTSLLADVVSLLVLGRLLARTISIPAAWCFTAFFAAWPYFSAVAVSGMESSLVLALLAVSAGLIETRSTAAGAALGMLALTRPEGLVAAAVISIGARPRARLVAAAIVSAGLIALTLYYGTFVPQSVVAKAATYGAPGPWAGRYWWDWLLPFTLGPRTRLGDTAILTLLSLVAAPALALGVLALRRARRGGLTLAAAAMLVVWLGYALVGVAYFWWYLELPLAAAAILAAAGLPALVRGRALYVWVGLTVAAAWGPSRTLYVGRWGEESQTFGHVAEYLRANARPGEKVMLEPIGMIGYRAPLRVVDEVGLVSPRVAERRKSGPGWYADIAAAERPDWLVMRYGLIRTGEAFAGAGAPFRGAAERDSLLGRYLMVAHEEDLRDQSLVILRRVR